MKAAISFLRARGFHDAADALEEEFPPPKEKVTVEDIERLADLFLGILPELPQPKRPLSAGVAKAISAALKREPLESWGAYFREVRGSDWLMGRSDSGWQASLLWLLGPRNRAKWESGAYRNTKSRRGEGGLRLWEQAQAIRRGTA